jgi:hypothetical protein
MFNGATTHDSARSYSMLRWPYASRHQKRTIPTACSFASYVQSTCTVGPVHRDNRVWGLCMSKIRADTRLTTLGFLQSQNSVQFHSARRPALQHLSGPYTLDRN